MAVIPGRIFREVERQLHLAGRAESVGKQRDEDILSAALGGGEGYAVAVGAKGRAGDRTARVALMQSGISEGAQAWQEVIRQVREVFSGCSEELLFERYYGAELTVLRLAEEEHYDRQTINRYREKVVSHCALLAAEKGLLCWGGQP